MAIMQNGKEIVDLQINGRQIESAMINDKLVYPNEIYSKYEGYFAFEIENDGTSNSSTKIDINVTGYTDFTIYYLNNNRILCSYSWGSAKNEWQQMWSSQYVGNFKQVILFGGSSAKIHLKQKNCKRILNFGYHGLDRIYLQESNIERVEGILSNRHRSAEYLFESCKNLSYITKDLFKDAVNVKSISSIFQNCPQIKTVPNGFFDYLVNCTDFSYCFKQSGIEVIPDNLFSMCSNAISFSYCFYSTKISYIPIDIFTGLKKIKNLSACFGLCQNLITIDKNIFNGLSSVTDVSACFIQCTGIKFFDGWFLQHLYNEIPNCINYSNMFAQSFDNLSFPLISMRFRSGVAYDSIFNGANIKYIMSLVIETGTPSTNYTQNCHSIFAGSAVSQIDQIDIFNIGDNVSVNYLSMFEKCVLLNTVGNITFHGIQSISLSNSFRGCEKLTHVGNIIGDITDCSLGRTFQDCPLLKSVGVINCDEASTDAPFLHCYNLHSVVFEGVVRLDSHIGDSTGVTSFICNKASIPTFASPFLLSVNEVVYELWESPDHDPRPYVALLSGDPKYKGGAHSGKWQPGFSRDQILSGHHRGWTMFYYYGDYMGDVWMSYKVDDNGNISTGW